MKCGVRFRTRWSSRLTMQPSAPAGRAAAKACISTKGARRLTAMWRSQLARSALSMSSWSKREALLTRQPSGPRASAARAARASTCASSARSALSATARPPCFSMSATTPAAASPESRWCTATAQPSCASASAMVRPMRAAPPVTRAARGIASDAAIAGGPWPGFLTMVMVCAALSGRQSRKGAQRDAGHRASDLTHAVGRKAPPFGSRPGARPRRRGPQP